MTGIPTLAIVGTGAVARAVASAHSAAGGVVEVVLSRDPTRAAALAAECSARASATDPAAIGRADVVLVCVSDRAVAEVGARLVAWLRPGAPMLHTSGALAGSALLDGGSEVSGAPAASRRPCVGSLHPLQSFPAGIPGPEGQAMLVARVRGAHWFHEGDGAADARALVSAWGGTFHALAAGSKSLYHAAAAIVSNHTVALFADATRLFGLAGVTPDDSRGALAALLDGTCANLRTVGVPQALTGPVSRGDVSTVCAHLAALRAAAPDVVDAYLALARRAVVVAREKGTLDAAGAAAVLDALR